MAKKQGKKEKSIEESLWDSANKLRGSVEPSEYKHVVLSLIFLKYANDSFIECRTQLIAEGQEKYVDVVAFYTAKNVFYLTEHSRWSYLMEHAKQPDIAIKMFGFEYPEEKFRALAAEIRVIVDDKSKYIDWENRSDIKAALKVDLIKVLDKYGYPPVPRDEVYKEIFEQAENFKKYAVS